MKTPKLSVVASVLSDDVREAARLARMHGFDGLQFDAVSPALRLADLSQTGRRDFVHVLSAQDQQLVGLRANVGPKGLGPGSDADRILHQLAGVLEVAAGLAAPLVCVELGPLPEPAIEQQAKPAITSQLAGVILLPEMTPQAPAPAAASAPDPAAVSQVDGAMLELGRAADRYSTVIAFRSELSSLAALERVLKSVNCPWFGIDLDPAAILRDRWDMDQALSRLGSLIRHVRGRDATAGSDRRTSPAVIGQGSTNWPALLANLDAAACNCPITVDSLELTNRLPAAVNGAAYLRKQFAVRV